MNIPDTHRSAGGLFAQRTHDFCIDVLIYMYVYIYEVYVCGVYIYEYLRHTPKCQGIVRAAHA